MVIRRSMIAALKRQELVNTGNSDGVGALEPHLATSGQRVDRIADARPAGGHYRRSRHVPIMNKARNREISACERARDQWHVSPDLCHTSGVAGVALKADAAAIRQRLKVVEGGVLIDAHGHTAASLDLVEGALGGSSATSQNQHNQHDCATHRRSESVFQLDLGDLALLRSLAQAPKYRFQQLDTE